MVRISCDGRTNWEKSSCTVTGSDFGPTQQQGEVQRLLREQLRSVKAQFDAVMSKDVEAFKQMLRSKNLQNVIISN